MANVNEITQSIQSLRAESSPDSVTPERVGALLQAITDLIKALSNVPEEEVVSVMAAVNQALSDAAAALKTAQTAKTTAANQTLAKLAFNADADGVSLAVKQIRHGDSEGLVAALPVADASQAGIVLPDTLQNISDAAALAEKNALGKVLVQYAATSVTLVFYNAAGAMLFAKTIGQASDTRAGLMSKEQFSKLAALPDTGFVTLDAAGRVPAAQAPQMMIRNTKDTSFDENPLQPGEFYFDSGYIFYVADTVNTLNMGVPSKNVVYVETDTNIAYRWNGSAFVPLQTDPNYSMQTVQVKRNDNTRKIYNVPNGKLAMMIVTTDTANIALSPAVSGASVHRMIFTADDFGNCSQINWPDGLTWRDNDVPDAQRVTDRKGIMITVYDLKFAEYNTYG